MKMIYPRCQASVFKKLGKPSDPYWPVCIVSCEEEATHKNGWECLCEQHRRKVIEWK